MTDQQLQRYLQEMVELIQLRIAESDLTKQQIGDRLIKEITDLLDQFGVTLEQVVPKRIALEYYGGVDEASALLVKAGAIERADKALIASGGIGKAFRKGVHLEAVTELLDDTMLDLRAAIRTAQQNAIGTINGTLQMVRDDIAQGLIAGDNRKVIQARVAMSFQQGGLTAFTTVDGKRLPLEFYAMTVSRTKTRQARVNGSTTRYEEIGQDLVRIVGNSDTCEVCARHQGMVVSLTGKTPGYPIVGKDIELPIYHPNCRCSVIPFVEQFKTQQEILEAKKRNAEYSPNADRRTPAQKKAYEKEQRLRRQANAEKKQFARFRMVLGEENYKSIGAFRRAKRENTPRFQDMQAEYRRVMREDVKPK